MNKRNQMLSKWAKETKIKKAKNWTSAANQLLIIYSWKYTVAHTLYIILLTIIKVSLLLLQLYLLYVYFKIIDYNSWTNKKNPPWFIVSFLRLTSILNAR